MALRVGVLASLLGVPDFDEATVGVQAQQFLDGRPAVFFPNQPYGGTLETGLVAVSFAVLGSSTLALKLVPIVLSLVAAFLGWRIARRVVPSRLGQWCVPVLLWCGPAAGVLQSTKERGFYGVALVLATAVILLVLRLEAEPTTRDMVLLGTAAGLGLWSTPLVVLVAVPAVAWLVARRPAVVGEALPAVPAALVAAAPWIAWNAHHGWASLEAPPALGSTWGDRFGDWLAKLPMVVGAEAPWDPDQRLVPWRLVTQLVVAVVVVAATARTRHRAPGLLALLVVGYGLLYACNGLAAGTGDDPRYLYLLLPPLALTLGTLVSDPAVSARRVPVLAAVAATTVALSAWGLVATRDAASAPGASKYLAPDGIGEVAGLLADREVGTAITDHSGMQISFLTHRRVVAASFAAPRLPAYERAARADPTSTYVLDAHALGNAGRLEAWLAARDVAVEHHTFGRWQVFLLDEQVTPEEAGLLAFGGAAG